MSYKDLLKKAEQFAKLASATDPFSFFNLPTDVGDAKDHASHRAFERGESHREAQLAIDFVNNVIAQLYRHHRDLVMMLPEGSEWSLPAPGGLTAIVKKAKNQLVHATFLAKGMMTPKTVSGSLEAEIRRLAAKR